MSFNQFSFFNFSNLQFLNFHGGSDLDQVIEAMDFAVYTHDIEHIVIDNLQFMMPRMNGRGGGGGGFERLDMQDVAIDRFRQFASDKRVNIFLVIHPRKEDDKIPLGLSSIFGTAKATQEADLVLILQRLQDKMYLEVKKNRYDGHLGKIDLQFSPITNAFYGLSLQYNATDTADFKVNQATGEIKIGGVSAGYFPTFYSAGTERMRIDTSGNVGIGVTSGIDANLRVDANSATLTQEILKVKSY